VGNSIRKTKGNILITAIFCLMGSCGSVTAQEFLPASPADRDLVYVLDQQNKLIPLPFEKAETPLRRDQAAKETKSSYVELKGEHSPAVLGVDQRIFLFTVERGGAHPPMIVWLTPRRGGRRVTAIAQKGLTGFAISAEDIVKPKVRGLTKEGDVIFVELRPRVSLAPGEYAIIGEDLNRVATFRVVAGGRN
jgi:hypothetical protein